MATGRSSENEALRQELRAWLKSNLPAGWSEQEIVPRKESMEEQAQFELWWHKKLYEGGWAGAHWPREYSGRGLTTEQRRIYQEEMARAQAVGVINSDRAFLSRWAL